MHLSKICITFHLELKMEFVQQMWKILNVSEWPDLSGDPESLSCSSNLVYSSGGIFLQNKTVACRDLLAMSAWLLLSSQQYVTFFSHTKYGNWNEILEPVLVRSIIQSHFSLVVFVVFKTNKVLLLDSKQNTFQYWVWVFLLAFFKIAKYYFMIRHETLQTGKHGKWNCSIRSWSNLLCQIV